MANYIFETMSAAQAQAFTADDYLIFITNSDTAQSVSVTPVAPPAGDTSPPGTDFGVTLAAGGQSLNFRSAPLSAASQANHLIFNDSTSHLIIGSNSAGDTDLTSTSTAASGSTAATTTVVYGLAGNDNITGGAGNDYLYGGVGADTIVAGNGSNHIYGNALTTTQGTADGADTIVAGLGDNYINGNAGKDLIEVGFDSEAGAGSTTSHGFNRVFGGADDDTIMVFGGMGSHNAVNGNQGSDTIEDMSAGSNTLRGGMGDDTITQSGASHDVIMGDVGKDTIVVSGTAGHVVVATGGADADVFNFAAAGAGNSATLNAMGTVVTTGGTTYYQEVTDFTVGTDHIILATQPTGTTGVGHADTVFTSVSEAATYAQTQLTDTTTVSALSVGSATNTYLFYHDGSTTSANGIIHLDNVDSQAITASAFQAAPVTPVSMVG